MRTFDEYFKQTAEIGYIQSTTSSIFYVSGLPNARVNELVLTENGMIGIVRAILSDLVEIMVFEGQSLVHNMKVVRTNEYFQIPASEAFLGRIIDPFGVAQDSLSPVSSSSMTYRYVDLPAPGISSRSRVTRQLETGVAAVDLLVPIGMGQRELVLGDPKTGKTTFCLQTIVSQAKAGTVCIYVSCGKKKSDLKFVENYLTGMNVIKKVVIIAASSSDPAPMVYMAPFSAMSIAEYFSSKDKDVLIVIDDMTTHAKFYREISLLSMRPPGRQSYPGDIFHLQARIAERAGSFKTKLGKQASITFLPIAETIDGDLTAYIATNLMAMTDGHIFFDAIEAKKGKLPAVNFGLSVTRVGYQTKSPLEREISDDITLKLAEIRQAQELGKFGVELTESTMQVIGEAGKIDAFFQQGANLIIPKDLSIIFAGLLMTKFWQEATFAHINFEKKILLEAYNLGYFDKLRLKIAKISDAKGLCDLIISEKKNFVQIIAKIKSKK